MPRSRQRKKKKHSAKKNKLDIYSPAFNINIPLISKITYDLWPKELFNTIEDVDACKSFYDKSYKRVLIEIQTILEKYHPAAWVRESFIQLEAWTLLFYGPQVTKNYFKVEGPKEFAAVGRYGWRYILEISLEKTEDTKISSSERPKSDDINNMFSLLFVLAQCAELSNYLHFMPKMFSSIKLRLNPILLLQIPYLDLPDQNNFDNITKSLSVKTNFDLYPQFAPYENEIMMNIINKMLVSNFGFTLDEIISFTENVLSNIVREIGASIIVDSLENFSELCAEKSTFTIDKIINILHFISLDVKSENYITRDFLVKSQQKRMINYCGAIIYLKNNLETIYTSSASKYWYIKDSSIHIILAPTLIEEWVQNFIMRLVYGQRSDLKTINKKINEEISVIEEYFHKEIFEKGITEILEKNGFNCINNLKKINSKSIECGEIDIIAYNSLSNILFVIESKNLTPTKDAKAMAQVISDHFGQKNYHKKFMKKIAWVTNNILPVSEIFKKDFGITIKDSPIKEFFFITGRNSIIMFMVKEYNVMSFVEFDNFLKEKNEL